MSKCYGSVLTVKSEFMPNCEKMFRSILLCIALSSITIDIALYALTDNLMELLYVNRLECKFNKTMCKSTKCSSKFYNRTTSIRITKVGTVQCDTMFPFESVKTHTTLHYHFTGGYRQFAINIQNDWCRYMDGTEKSILLDLFVEYIKGYSNFLKKCPFHGNFSFENLPLSAKIIGGQFLPVGDYYHQVVVNANGVHFLTVKMYFTIPAGQTLIDDAMGK